MLRLSKRAWNNVLIVSMLVMILLFNSTNNILNGDNYEASIVPLIPEDGILMTLEIGDIKVERIGRGWRANTTPVIPEVDLATLVQTWTQAQMISYELPSEDQPFVVIAWLAGAPEGLVFQLYPAAQGTLVKFQQQWYIVQDTPLSQFVLPGVL